MSMKEWAKREIEIACKNERGDSKAKKGDFDYGIACYKSALKAFNSLTKDGHSGMSIAFTKNILMRLIDGKPLTAIEDTDEVWNEVSDRFEASGRVKVYQCNRMSALFKHVYEDGTIKYSNVDSCYSIDINTGSTYTSGLVRRLIEERYPITMPYYPAGAIKVYCEEFLTDRKNGDFDTVGVFYAIKPDGERVEINRFFREGKGRKYPGWVEIGVVEYADRKEKSIILNKGD